MHDDCALMWFVVDSLHMSNNRECTPHTSALKIKQQKNTKKMIPTWTRLQRHLCRENRIIVAGLDLLLSTIPPCFWNNVVHVAWGAALPPCWVNKSQQSSVMANDVQSPCRCNMKQRFCSRLKSHFFHFTPWPFHLFHLRLSPTFKQIHLQAFHWLLSRRH